MFFKRPVKLYFTWFIAPWALFFIFHVAPSIQTNFTIVFQLTPNHISKPFQFFICPQNKIFGLTTHHKLVWTIGPVDILVRLYSQWEPVLWTVLYSQAHYITLNRAISHDFMLDIILFGTDPVGWQTAVQSLPSTQFIPCSTFLGSFQQRFHSSGNLTSPCRSRRSAQVWVTLFVHNSAIHHSKSQLKPSTFQIQKSRTHPYRRMKFQALSKWPPSQPCWFRLLHDSKCCADRATFSLPFVWIANLSATNIKIICN